MRSPYIVSVKGALRNRPYGRFVDARDRTKRVMLPFRAGSIRAGWLAGRSRKSRGGFWETASRFAWRADKTASLLGSPVGFVLGFEIRRFAQQTPAPADRKQAGVLPARGFLQFGFQARDGGGERGRDRSIPNTACDAPAVRRRSDWRHWNIFARSPAERSCQRPSNAVPGEAISAKIGVLSSTRRGSTLPRGDFQPSSVFPAPRATSVETRSR